MVITGEDKAAYAVIHSWLLSCFSIAHSFKKTIEGDFQLLCCSVCPHFWNIYLNSTKSCGTRLLKHSIFSLYAIKEFSLLLHFLCSGRKYCCHFQWGLPFISLLSNGFKVSKWYPIYLYSDATSVKHTFLTAECKL